MAGTSKNTITNAFGRNVGGRLFFAGEHTSAAYRGTVHGAFETGQVRTPRISPHLQRISHTLLPFTSPSPPFVPAQAAARAVKACSAGSCPASSPNSLPTVAAASGTPNTITLKLFEDGASAANFAFPTSLTFTAGSTYTVTVPAGYFHDGLGNNVAQFTSTFTISDASRRALQEGALTLTGFTPPNVTADPTWGAGYASAAKSIDHAAPAFTTNSTIRVTFSRAIRIPDDSDKVINIDELCDEGWGSCWESYSASVPYCTLPLIATDEDGEKITNPDIDVDGAQLLISPNENCPLYAGGQFRLKIPADAIYDMAETAMTTESAYYYFNTIPDTTPPTLQECPEAGAKWGATDVDETQPLVLCFNEEACNPPHITPRPHLDWSHAISHKSPPCLPHISHRSTLKQSQARTSHLLASTTALRSTHSPSR